MCFASIQEEITKQTGFIDDLCNYNSQQWVKFFRMKSSTAQALVEEVGPFFRKRDGSVDCSSWLPLWVELDFRCVWQEKSACVCVCVLQGVGGHKFIYRTKF